MQVRQSRRSFTELIGTMILVFIHSGIVLQYNKNPEEINTLGMHYIVTKYILIYLIIYKGVAMVQGLTNLALSYALGQV